jgi:hypothetical protein
MANNWITALKKFNESKDKFCVPKKGSEDYQKVLKLMKGDDKKRIVVKGLVEKYIPKKKK